MFNQNVINCALHSEPRCGEEAMKNRREQVIVLCPSQHPSGHPSTY